MLRKLQSCFFLVGACFKSGLILAWHLSRTGVLPGYGLASGALLDYDPLGWWMADRVISQICVRGIAPGPSLNEVLELSDPGVRHPVLTGRLRSPKVRHLQKTSAV
jgi:hypothetical protein